MRRLPRAAAVLALAGMLGTSVVAVGAVSAQTSGTTFVVNTTGDGPGGCGATTCTLRAAVAAANAAGGGTVLVTAPGTYVLSGGSGGDTGDLDVTAPVTIVGARKPRGAAATTIQGSGDRVLEVASTGAVLDGVVVTGGSARNGAGVLVRGGASLEVRDSTIAANIASDQGGGIDNAGTLALVRSTVSGNTATKKGGGIHSTGSLRLTDSTVHANESSSGGGVVVTSGDAVLTAVTVAGNRSTNKLGGGVQRAGGTVTIRGSVVAANEANSTTAKDCSGSPFLDGLNLIGNVQGCNPTGTAPLTGEAGLLPLAANGGATETLAPAPASQAVDALDPVAGACPTARDQRGVPRPQIAPGSTHEVARCDLGAVELERFNVTVGLRADVEEVSAGAAVIPEGALTDAVAAPAPEGPEASPLRSIPLRSIAVEALRLDSVPLRSIPLRSIPLRSIPLRSIPLRSILLAAPLRSIPLRSIALDSVLLSEIPVATEGGWEALLADTTLAGLPLQTLTLADLASIASDGDIQALTLEDVDLSATRIGALSLTAVLLGSTPLRSIDPGIPSWCDQDGLLGPQICETYGITNDSTLIEAELAGTPLRSIPLRSIPLRSIPLRSIDVADAPLRSIPLRSIPLESLGTIVDCTKVSDASLPCPGELLTIGDIYDDPNYATALVGSLADLLLAIVGPSNTGWEDVDLTAGGLAAVASPQEPTFTYTADVHVGGTRADTLDVDLTLPSGFVAKAGSWAFDGATVADPPFSPAADPEAAGATFTFTATNVAPGDHTLSVTAWAGVVLGPQTASASARGTATGEDPVSAGPATATVAVGEAFEDPTPADDHRPLVRDALHVAHISVPGDVDLYSFDVSASDAASGETVSLRLANLAADFDLALYGPPAEPLRGAPSDERDMLPDHLADLDPGDDNLTAEPTADVPQTLPFASPDVVARVGGRRGTAAETIENVALREGTYWIQVSSANGSFSLQPYVLRARFSPGADRGECPATPALGGGATATAPALPDGLDTLFVVAPGRLTSAYPESSTTPDGADAVAAVTAFAARDDLGFTGGVLNLDADSDVRGAYAAWDDDRCNPDAANAVVHEIGAAIDAVADDHPGLENVVIVGDDAQIPMARVVDATVVANERSFGDEIAGPNALTGALDRSYVLSDNPYATRRGIAVNDHELFVPELAVGRLVEAPADIIGALDRFDGAGGTLAPDTALVTGYDFLADGAHAVAGELAPAVPAGGLSTLIDEPGAEAPWTRAQLVDALGALEPGALASVNAHFDHSRALPSLGDATGVESDLFTIDDIDDPLRDALAGAVLFSMGCHSGLSVSDVAVGAAVDDWAQTFGGLGSAWVANTGYGYGDTDSVGFSEELMSVFARRLVAGDSVGRALATAKQQYIARRALVSAYDEKVVHEAVTYGLPMLRLAAGEPPAALATVAASVVNEPAPPAAPLAVDALTGLPAAERSFDFTEADAPDQGPGTLTRVITGSGAYYHVEGDTLAQPRRPIQPSTSVDVTHEPAAGEDPARAEGFLVTTLESTDHTGFAPVFSSPSIDQAAHEPVNVAADATFPSTVAAVTSTPSAGGRTDTLTVVPGQYRRSDAAGEGTQRLFTHVGGTVYYRTDGAPVGPPISVTETRAFFEGGRIRIEADLDADALRVYALYKLLDATGPVRWQGIDLVRTPDGTWIGHGLSVGPVEYTLQVVGPDGRVFRADAKGDNFGTVDGTVGALEVSATPAATASGWYAGPVTVTIAGPEQTDVGEILYSLDGADYTPYTGPFPLTSDGAHRIYALSTEGYSISAVIEIDATAPTIDASVDPPGVASPGWNAGPVTVSIVADDGAGSGVASLTYELDGADPVTVDGTTAAIPVSSTADVSVTATDHAGHTRTVPVGVRIDTTAPTFSCGTEPSGWQKDNVTLSCTTSDTESGPAAPTTFSLSTSVAAGAASEDASTNTVTICDTVGNCTPASRSGFRIDRALPTVSLTAPANGATIPAGSTATVSYSCADVGSGLASCSATANGSPIASGASVPTGAGGTLRLVVTATDVAGHVTEVIRTYTVFAYRICPRYDEDAPNKIGSTIPIKVEICDERGRNISSSELVLAAVTINKTNAPPPNFVGNTNYGNVFRFGQKQYVYNLDTGALAAMGLGEGTHTMELSINGNSIPAYKVSFRLVT